MKIAALPDQCDGAFVFNFFTTSIATYGFYVIIVGAYILRFAFMGTIPCLVNIICGKHYLAITVEYGENLQSQVAFEQDRKFIISSVVIWRECVWHKGLAAIIVNNSRNS